jgi:NAD(P)-dependent dehydrogenase (short-subunit alcohol dehydrogenase family)
MMKTILITGCSSGYGLETARQFHARGWNVIATMRTPRTDLFEASERMRILALDVTDPDSIALALELAGPIDVLVNNAGIGLFGALEHSPMEKIRDVYATNTLGTIAMTQAVIPQMRERGTGMIVNVTSSATLASFPLAAAYTGSKRAIQGFTGSLAHELAPARHCGEAGRTRLWSDDRLFAEHRHQARGCTARTLCRLCRADPCRHGRAADVHDRNGRRRSGVGGGA